MPKFPSKKALMRILHALDQSLDRREVLDKVFKKGVSSVKAKDLHRLFDQEYDAIRFDVDPERLLRKGWSPRGYPFGDEMIEQRLLNYYTPQQVAKLSELGPAGPMYDREVFTSLVKPNPVTLGYYRPMYLGKERDPWVWDEPGLYWADREYFGDPFTQVPARELMESIVPAHHASRFASKSPEDYLIQGILRPDARIIDYADLEPGRPVPHGVIKRWGEYIQTKPRQVLAKWKDLFAIIGLGAVMQRMYDERGKSNE